MNKIYEFNSVNKVEDMINDSRLHFWEKTKFCDIFAIILFFYSLYSLLIAKNPNVDLCIFMLCCSGFSLLLLMFAFVLRPSLVRKQFDMLNVKNTTRKYYCFSDKIYLVNKDVQELDSNIVKELEKFGIEKEKTFSYVDVVKIKKYKNCIILYLKNNLYIPLRKEYITTGNWEDCYIDLKTKIEQVKKQTTATK